MNFTNYLFLPNFIVQILFLMLTISPAKGADIFNELMSAPAQPKRVTDALRTAVQMYDRGEYEGKSSAPARLFFTSQVYASHAAKDAPSIVGFPELVTIQKLDIFNQDIFQTAVANLNYQYKKMRERAEQEALRTQRPDTYYITYEMLIVYKPEVLNVLPDWGIVNGGVVPVRIRKLSSFKADLNSDYWQASGGDSAFATNLFLKMLADASVNWYGDKQFEAYKLEFGSTPNWDRMWDYEMRRVVNTPNSNFKFDSQGRPYFKDPEKMEKDPWAAGFVADRAASYRHLLHVLEKSNAVNLSPYIERIIIAPGTRDQVLQNVRSSIERFMTEDRTLTPSKYDLRALARIDIEERMRVIESLLDESLPADPSPVQKTAVDTRIVEAAKDLNNGAEHYEDLIASRVKEIKMSSSGASRFKQLSDCARPLLDTDRTE